MQVFPLTKSKLDESGKKYLKRHSTDEPPLGCPHKVGDVVRFRNGNDLVFEAPILGFVPMRTDWINQASLFVYTDAYWNPIPGSRLI